jgi:hypothetical protein
MDDLRGWFYALIVIFVLFFGVGDLTTTYLVTSKYGIEKEKNKFARSIYRAFGYPGLVAVKALGMAVLIALQLLLYEISPTWACAMMGLGAFIGIFVTIGNGLTYIIKRSRPQEAQ